MTISNLRSSVYMEIFPDDEMIEAFGHLQPSLSERNAYFFDKWMEWRSNRIKIPPEIVNGLASKRTPGVIMGGKKKEYEGAIREVCKGIGLREFWDYQVKPGEVRFAQSDYMAMFKINWDKNG